MSRSNFYEKITREQFVDSLTDDPADKFTKTFVAKADSMKLWDDCVGVLTPEGKVIVAIIVSHGKTNPKCANLQLLHTFKEFRGRGFARYMIMLEFEAAHILQLEYFRVSSEPDALVFYEKLGFKFQGKQKSGCSLSICRLTKPDPKYCVYTMYDSYICGKVLSKAKGGCVSLNEWAQAELDTNVLDGFTTES